MNFPTQTFTWLDIPLIFLLFFVEVLLSADNAALLSQITKHLSKAKQKRALFIGVFSALFLRGIGILAASFLIHLFWLQILGGLYLIFIAIKSIIYKKEKGLKPKFHQKRSLFYTILVVEFTDIIFAIDSILAAFAIVAIYYPIQFVDQKLWVIYLGGLLGLLFIRYATTIVSKIVKKVPSLEFTIHLLIGWMGLKLLFEGISLLILSQSWQDFLDLFFWLGSIVIILIGFLSTKSHKKV